MFALSIALALISPKDHILLKTDIHSFLEYRNISVQHMKAKIQISKVSIPKPIMVLLGQTIKQFIWYPFYDIRDESLTNTNVSVRRICKPIPISPISPIPKRYRVHTDFFSYRYWYRVSVPGIGIIMGIFLRDFAIFWFLNQKSREQNDHILTKWPKFKHSQKRDQ